MSFLAGLLLGLVTLPVVRYVCLITCRSNEQMHRKLIDQLDARLAYERQLYDNGGRPR